MGHNIATSQRQGGNGNLKIEPGPNLLTSQRFDKGNQLGLEIGKQQMNSGRHGANVNFEINMGGDKDMRRMSSVMNINKNAMNFQNLNPNPPKDNNANLNKTVDQSVISTNNKSAVSRLDAVTNRTGGKKKKTASQSIMQSQIDETLRDVNDKVKDIVNSLRETKKALAKDYSDISK